MTLTYNVQSRKKQEAIIIASCFVLSCFVDFVTPLKGNSSKIKNDVAKELPAPRLSQQFFQFADVTARDGDGVVVVAHNELHGARIGGYLIH